MARHKISVYISNLGLQDKTIEFKAKPKLKHHFPSLENLENYSLLSTVFYTSRFYLFFMSKIQLFLT